MNSAKTISLLGATGSIGKSVLSVIGSQPGRFKVHAVVANKSVKKLAEIAISCNAKLAVLADPNEYTALKEALSGTGIEVGAGSNAVETAAAQSVDLVVAAIVGAAGVRPTWTSLRAGNQIALANKECLVSAGRLFTDEAHRQGKCILPLDSEHNAIWQVFEHKQRSAIEAITLTASGGPFRLWPKAKIDKATPEQALNHPNWSMGAKVTIDSATLMNKGLELIEAMHLFDLSSDQLRVLVHPQSIVHGLVHYEDGSVLAQLGYPDMRVPVAYCLNWPDRGPSPVKRLDLAQVHKLEFEEADRERFPCLGLAYDAMSEGTVATNALNAANEVAVCAFLENRLPFNAIVHIVDKVLEETTQTLGGVSFQSIEEAVQCDLTARLRAEKYVNSFSP